MVIIERQIKACGCHTSQRRDCDYHTKVVKAYTKAGKACDYDTKEVAVI